jgi:hypothetical protein
MVCNDQRPVGACAGKVCPMRPAGAHHSGQGSAMAHPGGSVAAPGSQLTTPKHEEQLQDSRDWPEQTGLASADETSGSGGSTMAVVLVALVMLGGGGYAVHSGAAHRLCGKQPRHSYDKLPTAGARVPVSF